MPPDLKPEHTPVLLTEVMQALAPQPGKIYVDATLGAGGHARAILEAIHPNGRLIGVDQDPQALEITRKKLVESNGGFEIIQGNFSQLAKLLPENAKPVTGGILADIGVSSMQLDTAERGFSFLKDAPLDMRMSPKTHQTAANLVNHVTETELVRIFSEYGEEHLSKTIARAIIEQRKTHPFASTFDLADLIRRIYEQRGKHEKTHPATRVFQALRIAVNDELGSLQRFLEQVPDLLAPGAHIAIISFHSLEDRLVKRFFQDESKDCICPARFPVCQCNHRARLKILTRKPIEASESEVRANPRARSAHLRVAERL